MEQEDEHRRHHQPGQQELVELLDALGIEHGLLLVALEFRHRVEEFPGLPGLAQGLPGVGVVDGVGVGHLGVHGWLLRLERGKVNLEDGGQGLGRFQTGALALFEPLDGARGHAEHFGQLALRPSALQPEFPDDHSFTLCFEASPSCRREWPRQTTRTRHPRDTTATSVSIQRLAAWPRVTWRRLSQSSAAWAGGPFPR